MKKELEEQRKNRLIEVYSYSGGCPTSGKEGYIITTDQKIYYYHEYFYVAPLLENKVTREGITEGKKLRNEKYQKIIRLIEEKILNKKLEYNQIFDAMFHIEGKYQGQKFNIINHLDLYDEINMIVRGEK